jgi:RNA polymerase sigma factor (TIGR02999 family)
VRAFSRRRAIRYTVIMSQITAILRQIDEGNGQAAQELLPLLYDELRRLAARELMNEPAGNSLQATALVHEAYLRLVGSDQEVTWSHRGHFFMAAARAMRRILVDHARARHAKKRGGGLRRVPLDEQALQGRCPDAELISLHEALEKLGAERPDLARLVELRYFGGQTLSDAAASLGVSIRTAERNWTYAKAWLKQAMLEGGGDGA